MGVARRWVFPIIWMVIFAVIAAALVKIAFFPDDANAGGDIDIPTGEIVDPQIAVSIGTIRNDIVLDGTVNADPAKPVKATLAGEVRGVKVKQGQKVKKGAALFTIRSEEFTNEGEPIVRTATVQAGSGGTISSLGVLEGQLVTVGEVVGQIAPPTFNVSTTLPPEQQYRLLEEPKEAEVAVLNGPAPFMCTKLTITTPLAGADGGEGGEGGSGATVRCSVPSDVRVFAGLSATLTIAGGIAENVLVLPMTAVEGSADSGIVHLVSPDGSIVETPVVLGLNDGINVEIVSGVNEGDLVLQFIPGAPSDGGDPWDPGFPIEDDILIDDEGVIIGEGA